MRVLFVIAARIAYGWMATFAYQSWRWWLCGLGLAAGLILVGWLVWR